MNNITTKKLSPILWISTLYFAMGLPNIILSQTSVLMFKNMGVGNASITYWTSLIMLPWTLKFIWSPFLEIYRSRKHIVLITQGLTAVCFALTVISLPFEHFFKYVIALFAVVAFSGATHDIAADGIYLNALDQTQQAKYLGWQGAFFNAAKLISAGVFVALAGILEKELGVTHAWMVVMGVCTAVMAAICLLHIRTLPSAKASAAQADMHHAKETMKAAFSQFVRKKHIIYYIFFIILYRFAEGFAIKIIPLFLRAERATGGLGLDTEVIGYIVGIAGSGAFVLGSIIGGYVISKYGLKKSLFKYCLVFNIPYIIYFLLALYRPFNHWLIAGGVGLEYFGYGFGFVGLTCFMMQQIAPGKYNMAHYAIASGVMNLGFMVPGMVSGWICDFVGYQNFFMFVLVATIPAILMTWFVPFTYDENNPAPQS